MICPNCHCSYDSHETICRQCGHPLGNADYTLVPDNPQQPKRHSRFWIILPLILLVGIIVGVCGYYYYLSVVEKKCREATDQIFHMAKNMDFSSVDPSYLPSELQEEPNIRALIQKELETALQNSGLDNLIDLSGTCLDTNALCEDIAQSAHYEILSVDTDYHSCVVTVRTENTDFAQIPSVLYEELQEELSRSSSFWSSVNSFLSSLLRGEQPESDNSLEDHLEQMYENAREEASKTEYTGTVSFGIQDGTWTLTDIDTELFYHYYGISDFITDN